MSRLGIGAWGRNNACHLVFDGQWMLRPSDCRENSIIVTTPTF